MTSKSKRNFQGRSSNAQRYNNITKVNLKNTKNLNPMTSSLYNTERLNSINKLSLINSSLITQQRAQREALISHSTDFYKNIEIARQQAIEQRSKFLARMYHTSFQNQFETDLQKNCNCFLNKIKNVKKDLKKYFLSLTKNLNISM